MQWDQLSELERRALELAMELHAGAADKAGEPYIQHVLRVAGLSADATKNPLLSDRCRPGDERVVALLHDVVEDCNVTSEQLLANGFTQLQVAAILDVTRREEESYMDFVRRAAGNPIAIWVKLSDLADNADLERLAKIGIDERSQSRQRRYLRAMDELIPIAARLDPERASRYQQLRERLAGPGLGLR